MPSWSPDISKQNIIVSKINHCRNLHVNRSRDFSCAKWSQQAKHEQTKTNGTFMHKMSFLLTLFWFYTSYKNSSNTSVKMQRERNRTRFNLTQISVERRSGPVLFGSPVLNLVNYFPRGFNSRGSEPNQVEIGERQWG